MCGPGNAALRLSGRDAALPQMSLRHQRSGLVKIIENIDELLIPDLDSQT